jgi:hypothetical protein
MKILTISEEQAYSEIQPHIRRFWNCMTNAYGRYRNYPDIQIHRKSTRANIVSDLIFANIVAEFDEVPGTRILFQETRQLRFLSLSDQVTIWFKKLDDSRTSSNVSTQQAEELNRGQLSLFSEAALVIAGYQLNDDETAIKCISFSPPNLVFPRWFIDVDEVPQPLVMHELKPAEPGVRLRVAIGPEQRIII